LSQLSVWTVFTHIRHEFISIISLQKVKLFNGSSGSVQRRLGRQNKLSKERILSRGKPMVNFGRKSDLSGGRGKWARASRRGRRKIFSFAGVAALLLLAIGASACLYIPAIPEDPTPTPGWDQNKVQLQKNGIQLQQSAAGHSDSASEVASSVAAKP
jgi:hypothetical protein